MREIFIHIITRGVGGINQGTRTSGAPWYRVGSAEVATKSMYVSAEKIEAGSVTEDASMESGEKDNRQ